MKVKIIVGYTALSVALVSIGFYIGGNYSTKNVIKEKTIDERIMDCLQLGSDERAGVCIELVNKAEEAKMIPLKPSKDIYSVGEDMNYGYLTLRIESVKKISDNQIEVDIYSYNSKDNRNQILMFNSQFHLESSERFRIESNYDDGRFRGVEVYPDQAVRGRVIFQNDALKQDKTFVLKAQPFDGSPALTIDMEGYL